MIAVLMDRKGFHKVVTFQGERIRVIRWAAMDLRPIADPIEDPFELVESRELCFRYDRQLTHDTFLYREEWVDNTHHARSQANET